MTIPRTRAEAESLAESLLVQAWAGADFDSLVEVRSDADYPGIFALANHDVPPDSGEYRRATFVQRFGDVSFCLSPGNIDLADYDPLTSPYGWHLIKRLD
jgi:hypothetical protein